jgi:uncharacterized protein
MMNVNSIWLKKGMPLVILVAVFFLLTSLLKPFSAFGEEKRVFDDAGLFTTEERNSFESQITSMKKEMNMDVLVVTTDETGGKSAQQYAEDFYIDGSYGVGSDYRGVLFLIDMKNREMYILPVGKMNRFLTDERWNAILDKSYESASKGDYSASAKAFLDGVIKYYRAGIPGGQYNYDKETGEISIYRSIRWYEALVAAAIAFFVAGTACLTVSAQYSMKKERNRTGNYLKAYRGVSEFRYSEKMDNLINKTVTHVIIPRNNNNGGSGGSSGGGFSPGRSTTHSSSGRTMGGGGRKF